MACSEERQTLSRYQESRERLMTPMIAGRELKANAWPPMANSFTRAWAAERCWASNSARYSRVNMYDGLARLYQFRLIKNKCDERSPSPRPSPPRRGWTSLEAWKTSAFRLQSPPPADPGEEQFRA